MSPKGAVFRGNGRVAAALPVSRLSTALNGRLGYFLAFFRKISAARAYAGFCGFDAAS